MNCLVDCGKGQTFNCNALADTCFQSVYAMPLLPTTNVTQVALDGTRAEIMQFAMCIEVGLPVKVSQGDHCNVTVNDATLDANRETNSAWSKHPTKGKVSVLFTYMIVFLCVAMVIAAEL